MALDVIITPASGLVDFQNSGISSATIQLDGNGNLNIASSGGDIQIGDTSSDVYIGDGVNNVDIVFEQSGEIRGLTGKTITLGQSDSFVAFAGTVTGDVTFTGKLVFPDNGTVPDDPTNEQYDYMTFGANGSISQVSGRGALMIASSDDSLILANGDVGRTFTSSNIDVDTENIFLLSDANVTVKTDLQSGFGSENTYTFAGGVITSPRFTSTQATGTAPFTVSSTTVVSNLNADLLDGQEGSYYTNASNISSGTLAIARGGTNSSATPTQGGVAYGDGTSYAFTGAGTTGKVLTSNGSGAPTWEDTLAAGGTEGAVQYNSSSSLAGIATLMSIDSTNFNVGIGTRIDIVPYDTQDNGTLSFEGSAGQLFSITNNLTSGSIFSVNDVSGIPSIDVDADGTVLIAPYGSTEYVGIGTTNPTAKLDVNGTLNVTGVSTFQGNVYLGDNDTLYFGDGNDLRILHNGTDSYIIDEGSGNLIIRGQQYIALQNLGGENYFRAGSDGAVELYYDNSKKFETTGYGVTVSGGLNVSGITTFQGNVYLGDGDSLYFGDSNDLRISHDGSNSVIRELGSGNLYFTSNGAGIILQKDAGNENLARFLNDGSVELYHANSKKFETTGYGVTVSGGIYVSGISTFQGGIHDGTSLGTPGQVLSSTGTGLSWIDAAAGGGGGGSGTFDTGITTSIYVSVTSGVGTNTAETNDIFVGPSIAYTFPSTSGKKYVIESIHITNTFANELYFVGRHDFNGGSNVPLAQRVIVPYQGATEFLDQPIIANPSDILRFQALTGTGSTATGIDGGLDAFITYSTKDDTDYIGTGKTVTTAAGTEIFQATSNPAMLQSIKLCNYSLNSDIDASISIYNDGLSSGTRLGYLVYNLTVPKNSVIEILEKPKYLATNAAIVGGASAANVLGVTLSGKYIT